MIDIIDRDMNTKDVNPFMTCKADYFKHKIICITMFTVI